MKSAEMRAIRERLGIGQPEWARLFGHQGDDASLQVRTARWESEAPTARSIPPGVARLAAMFGRCGVPDDFRSLPPDLGMSGQDLQRIRKGLRLSIVEFARTLGYEGLDNTIGVTIRRFEAGKRELPPWVPRLTTMFQRFGVPEDFLPDNEADHDAR